MQQAIIIIPAYQPNGSLLRLVRNLRAVGFRVIVVDDGSGPDYAHLFSEVEQENCVVARHPKNMGKGAALKTGVREAIRRYGPGNAYITADADGQHLPEDILKIAVEMECSPDALVLGTRDFSAEGVPSRSRFGNRVTSAVFRLTHGISCPDTQTGLRGIPAILEELALSEEGSRYEYEMNFLSDAARRVPLCFVPIQTVYHDGNRASHFRPIMDSVLVYGRFLRFAAASLSGAAVDVALFYFLSHAIALPRVWMIFAATAIARVASGLVNYLLNRYFSFQSRQPMGEEILRYGVLFLCQMGASAGLVALLSLPPVPVVLVKIIVDGCLFFLSFTIQKNWVFRKGGA